MALLEAAVVTDRLRGVSWFDVADALGVSAEGAEERFTSAERRFRDALLFPHRHPENGGYGYTAAPYAVEQPERVRQQLDAWVVQHRRSGGLGRDEPEPVTRCLAAMAKIWIAERIGQVLELSDALMKRELPDGVSYTDAQLRHAQMQVELHEAMAEERPETERSNSNSPTLDSASPSYRAQLPRSRLSSSLSPFARQSGASHTRQRPPRLIPDRTELHTINPQKD
jgi:hypothetical protein